MNYSNGLVRQEHYPVQSIPGLAPLKLTLAISLLSAAGAASAFEFNTGSD